MCDVRNTRLVDAPQDKARTTYINYLWNYFTELLITTTYLYRPRNYSHWFNIQKPIHY